MHDENGTLRYERHLEGLIRCAVAPPAAVKGVEMWQTSCSIFSVRAASRKKKEKPFRCMKALLSPQFDRGKYASFWRCKEIFLLFGNSDLANSNHELNGLVCFYIRIRPNLALVFAHLLVRRGLAVL